MKIIALILSMVSVLALEIIYFTRLYHIARRPRHTVWSDLHRSRCIHYRPLDGKHDPDLPIARRNWRLESREQSSRQTRNRIGQLRLSVSATCYKRRNQTPNVPRRWHLVAPRANTKTHLATLYLEGSNQNHHLRCHTTMHDYLASCPYVGESLFLLFVFGVWECSADFS